MFDVETIMLQLLYDNAAYALPLLQIQDSLASLPLYLLSSAFTGSECECVQQYAVTSLCWGSTAADNVALAFRDLQLNTG